MRSSVKDGASRIQCDQRNAPGFKIKSRIKAGEIEGDKIITNHNQTVSRAFKIKSRIKAGEINSYKITTNHSQTLSRGVKIKSGVKAGGKDLNHNQMVRSAC